MKQLIIVGSILFIVGAAIGRFTVPAKVEIKSVTTESDTSHSTKNVQINDHSVVVVTDTKHADGSETVVTEMHKDVHTGEADTSSTTDHKTSDTEKTVTYNTMRWGIDAIASAKPLSGGSVSYGGAVRYRVVGPFNVGALGLSDGTVGVSLGLSF